MKDSDKKKAEAPTIHELKTWPIFFEAILNGTKTFEVRYNDRRFKVGDRLDLLEFNPDAMENGEYTGRHCHRFISYILDSNPFIDLQGYAILGLQPQSMEEYAAQSAVVVPVDDKFEKAFQQHIPTDEEIDYRASLIAGVPCDDPQIYGSYAFDVYEAAKLMGKWMKEQIK